MSFSLKDKTFDEMLSFLREILQIDTVKSAASEGKPFGEGNALCLEKVLDKAKEMGFETFNCDNYAGHVDFGNGDEIFGILGHLDVVPAEGKWTYPPFGGEIKDGVLYGRGVLDDKGPMIACLYALKQLKDEGFVPSKKIRLIFGCDEESGWGCMDYYSSKIKLPDVGFSPDGDFPVINVEKGVCHLTMTVDGLPKSIKNISGGSRVNIVMDDCFVQIEGDVSVSGCEKTFKDGNTFLRCVGKAAHGSTPQYGDNAFKKLADLLHKIYPENDCISFVSQKAAADFFGKSWGVNLSDKQSGDMTINVGKVRTQQGKLLLGLDIRYPVSYTQEQVLDLLKCRSPKGCTFEVNGSHPPLYVAEDTPLVKTLLEVFEKETGKKAKPLAVGGATYARALPLGVAFGPVFEDDEKVIHEKDERVSLDKLRLMMTLYYQAIKKLC